jgi:hypothetical protein
MMAVQQLAPFMEIRLGDWYAADVYMLPSARKFIDLHQLTPPMVDELAKIVGRYPICEERYQDELIIRGLVEQREDMSYHLTRLGKKVCDKMFLVRILKAWRYHD